MAGITWQQRETFKEFVKAGGRIPMGEAMRRGGYSDKKANQPSRLRNSKGWQELMAGIDEEPLVNRLIEIALDNDKRAALAAIDQIMTLKDRKPSGKLKVQAWNEQVEKLQEIGERGGDNPSLEESSDVSLQLQAPSSKLQL